MNLRYVENNGGPGVVLTEAALSTMDKYRQVLHTDKEAGGQLFAAFQGTDTVIVEATHPKWLDRRTRYGFVPNRLLQQREIKDRYKRGLHFVGDWHTHAELTPNPSCEDVDSMIKCYKLSRHDLKAFVMVIIGKEPAPTGLHVALVRGETICPLVLDI